MDALYHRRRRSSGGAHQRAGSRILPLNCLLFDLTSYTDAVHGHHLTAMKALRQKHGGKGKSKTAVGARLASEDVIPNE